MLDDQLLNERCSCRNCQRAQQRHAANPGLPWINPHKYDYLHAEDEEGWTFRTFCRCGLCRAERQRLAQRVERK